MRQFLKIIAFIKTEKKVQYSSTLKKIIVIVFAFTVVNSNRKQKENIEFGFEKNILFFQIVFVITSCHKRAAL